MQQQTHIPNTNTQIYSIATKIIVVACLITYIYMHASSGQIMLLASTVGLLLAFMSRIDTINASGDDHHKRAVNSTSFDGGTYNKKQQVKTVIQLNPAVNDGGSFDRSVLKLKKAA